jgi:ATP-binding cassette subfamily B protein RaxB
MPMAYNTLIGDMGAALSGGQKERAVNDAIRSHNLTRIIIAHRPETIASAERVIVLQGSKVAQDLRRVAGEAGVNRGAG